MTAEHTQSAPSDDCCILSMDYIGRVQIKGD